MRPAVFMRDRLTFEIYDLDSMQETSFTSCNFDRLMSFELVATNDARRSAATGHRWFISEDELTPIPSGDIQQWIDQWTKKHFVELL